MRILNVQKEEAFKKSAHTTVLKIHLKNRSKNTMTAINFKNIP